MRKSISDQLLKYLQTNVGVFSSGELQRMTWTNKSGSIATPRTVVRRLQELAEDGKVSVTTINGHAHYSADPIIKPAKPQLTYDPIKNVMVYR